LLFSPAIFAIFAGDDYCCRPILGHYCSDTDEADGRFFRRLAISPPRFRLIAAATGHYFFRFSRRQIFLRCRFSPAI
jgi:hypothetical protein